MRAGVCLIGMLGRASGVRERRDPFDLSGRRQARSACAHTWHTHACTRMRSFVSRAAIAISSAESRSVPCGDGREGPETPLGSQRAACSRRPKIATPHILSRTLRTVLYICTVCSHARMHAHTHAVCVACMHKTHKTLKTKNLFPRRRRAAPARALTCRPLPPPPPFFFFFFGRIGGRERGAF